MSSDSESEQDDEEFIDKVEEEKKDDNLGKLQNLFQTMRSSFSFFNKKDLNQYEVKTNLQSKNLTKSIKKAPKFKSSNPLTCIKMAEALTWIENPK